jgi:hypothetical protein
VEGDTNIAVFPRVAAVADDTRDDDQPWWAGYLDPITCSELLAKAEHGQFLMRWCRSKDATVVLIMNCHVRLRCAALCCTPLYFPDSALLLLITTVMYVCAALRCAAHLCTSQTALCSSNHNCHVRLRCAAHLCTSRTALCSSNHNCHVRLRCAAHLCTSRTALCSSNHNCYVRLRCAALCCTPLYFLESAHLLSSLDTTIIT